MNNIALFGLKLSYSKSKYIHEIFSNQINIKYNYLNYEIDNENINFEFLNFFKKNGYGANITIPYKEKIIPLCNILTDNAKLSNSVNTIKKNNNKLIGENTDGLGLLFDLNRLNYIKKNKKNYILIIGAGGASKGIIPILYNNNCKILLTNRTFEKAIYIKDYFFKNNIYIDIIEMKKIKNIKFDIIINATSSSLNDEIPNINKSVINNNIIIYDLFYKNKNTEFIK